LCGILKVANYARQRKVGRLVRGVGLFWRAARPAPVRCSKRTIRAAISAFVLASVRMSWASGSPSAVFSWCATPTQQSGRARRSPTRGHRIERDHDLEVPRFGSHISDCGLTIRVSQDIMIDRQNRMASTASNDAGELLRVDFLELEPQRAAPPTNVITHRRLGDDDPALLGEPITDPLRRAAVYAARSDRQSGSQRSTPATAPNAGAAAPPAAYAPAEPLTKARDAPCDRARHTDAPTRASTDRRTRDPCGSSRTASL
jgi:hypothetical protein